MSARPGYQFVDTNVLVCTHDTSAGAKRDRAARLLEELWESRLGCLNGKFHVFEFQIISQNTPHTTFSA